MARRRDPRTELVLPGMSSTNSIQQDGKHGNRFPPPYRYRSGLMCLADGHDLGQRLSQVLLFRHPQNVMDMGQIQVRAYSSKSICHVLEENTTAESLQMAT